jgi:hypothetical protein
MTTPTVTKFLVSQNVLDMFLRMHRHLTNMPYSITETLGIEDDGPCLNCDGEDMSQPCICDSNNPYWRAINEVEAVKNGVFRFQVTGNVVRIQVVQQTAIGDGNAQAGPGGNASVTIIGRTDA